MKKLKNYLLLFFIVLFMPLVVFAEDGDTVMETIDVQGCELISGTGQNIGDEVACGTERFYILNNDGEYLKMLAKYNLYVGSNYDYILFDEPFTSYDEMINYLSENYSEYDGIYSADSSGESYIGAFLYHNIVTDVVSQSQLAIGAHGSVSGSPEFPEYGVVNLRNGGFSLNYVDSYGDGYFYDFDLDGNLAFYVNQYKLFLQSNNIDVSDINLLTLKEIDELVQKLSNKTLPLTQWMDNASFGSLSDWYVIGSLVDYIPEKYSWLYSTTYWTRTGTRPYESNGYTFFVDTLGDLCAAGSCAEAVGAGIRPVVTVPVQNLLYLITTRTDGNGMVVSSKDKSKSEEVIEFTVTPNEGYTLKKVLVTTETGDTLEFNDYKFTMPSDDVEIYAEFEKVINPSTGFMLPIAIIIGCVICTVFVYLAQRENNYNM